MRLEFPGENGHLGLSSFPHSDREAAEARGWKGVSGGPGIVKGRMHISLWG